MTDAQHKFKVGDKVRNLYHGRLGKVIRLPDYPEGYPDHQIMCWVQWPGGNESGTPMREVELKLESDHVKAEGESNEG